MKAGHRAVVLLMGCFGAPAFSQALPSAIEREAERIQEREQERRRERETTLRDELVTPPTGAETRASKPEASAEGRCVPIREVKFQGMSRFSREDFAPELASLTGTCVSSGRISDALRAITNRYVSAGYVTSRAVVGPQDLQDGILDVVVVEGSVGDIRSPSGGYGKLALAAAFPGLERRQLNLRAIEQGVDQLSRLPSSEPDVDIEPGSLPGSSTVSIRRKLAGRRIRPAFAIDNEGQAATGRAQSNTSLDADNIFGVADFWSIYHLRDLSDRSDAGNRGMGGFVSVPYGYWTLTLTGGRYTYRSVLEGADLAFSNTGSSWNAGATLDRMLYRDARTKLSVSATLGLLDTENRIQDIRLSTSSYRLVTGKLEARLQRNLWGGIATADLGVTRGLDALGAQAADTGPDGPDVVFGKVEGALGFRTRRKVFGVPLDYSGLLRGQLALDPLLPAERLSLGGSSTVRGFRDDGISGRDGAFMRQQVGFPIVAVPGGGIGDVALAGYVAYDAGGVLPRDGDRFERGFLQSSTLGLRFQHQHVRVEISASAPLSAPSFVRHRAVETAASVRFAL